MLTVRLAQLLAHAAFSGVLYGLDTGPEIMAHLRAEDLLLVLQAGTHICLKGVLQVLEPETGRGKHIGVSCCGVTRRKVS